MSITIIEHEELKYVVSARELYELLQPRRSFEYVCIEKINNKRFKEDIDYIILTGSVPYEDTTPRIDYLITFKLALYIIRFIANNKTKSIERLFRLLIKKNHTKEKINYFTRRLNIIDGGLESIYGNSKFNITFK